MHPCAVLYPGSQRQPCNSGYRLSRNIFKCLVLWSVTLSQGPPTLEMELLCDLYTGKLHDHPLWLIVGWCDFSIYLSWLYSYGFVLVRTWNDYPLSLTAGWCDFSLDLPLFCNYAYVFKSLKMIYNWKTHIKWGYCNCAGFQWTSKKKTWMRADTCMCISDKNLEIGCHASWKTTADGSYLWEETNHSSRWLSMWWTRFIEKYKKIYYYLQSN